MPVYEFECNKCGHKFDLAESIQQHDKHQEKCPKCKSADIRTVIGAVAVRTAKKS